MTPYYDQDGITIYHGDCREILPTLPKVDLVLTDPPYGTESLAGGYGRRQLHSPDGRHGMRIKGDRDLALLSEAAPLMFSALPDAAYSVVFCAARRMPEAVAAVTAAGFEYFGHCIWNKVAPGLGYSIRYAHEDALVFAKGVPPRPLPAVISVVTATVNRVNTHEAHPHEKPVMFWRAMLPLLGNGSVVLDPFMGSGSALVATKNLGRRAIGIEIEERYCAIAAKRLAQQILSMEGPHG